MSDNVTVELVVKMDDIPIYSVGVSRESLMEMEVNISDDDFVKGVEIALSLIKESILKKLKKKLRFTCDRPDCEGPNCKWCKKN